MIQASAFIAHESSTGGAFGALHRHDFVVLKSATGTEMSWLDNAGENFSPCSMKRFLFLLAIFSVDVLLASLFAREKLRGGIVYGLKAAFKTDAPEGRVLDNESGVQHPALALVLPTSAARVCSVHLHDGG